MTKLEELKAKREQLRKEMLEESKAVFAKESKRLFDAHPRLQSFSWTQYTPFFNDGDECVFSAHTDYLTLIIDGVETSETEDICEWTLESESFSKYHPALASDTSAVAACSDALAFMRCFSSEELKQMFDDHVRVTASRTGVESEAYDHD